MREDSSKSSKPRGKKSSFGLSLFVSALATAAAAGATEDPLPRLLVRFGELYSEGRLAEARDAAKAVLVEVERTRPSLDLDRATGLNNLAAIEGALGDWERAEPLFLEALRVAEEVAGPEDAARAILLYNVAGLHVQRARYDAAEALYERSLAIWEAIDRATQTTAAETLNNLAFLRRQRRSYDDAERLFRRALAIWERYGDSPEHAVTLSNLALLTAERGSLDEAEALYRKGLAMEEAAFGNAHPEIAITLNALGRVLAKKGRREDAVGLHRRALSILESTVGPEDPWTRETIELIEAGGGAAVFQLILVRAQSEAANLAKRIQQGEDMGALAREHSVDPSAQSGGFLTMTPSELRREVREELARLNAGQVSAPFAVGEAWAIVRKGR